MKDEANGGRPGETTFDQMDREELLRALEVFAKNWLALDGCWFLAAEDRFGLDGAIDLDASAWERYSAAEARRIMTAFGVPANGGLEALAGVLRLRPYALVNPQRLEWSPDRRRLRFNVLSCRVQGTRERKELPPFPCKRVGAVEFSGLARAVDPRISVACVYCPPDHDRKTCSWEFTLSESAEGPAGGD